MLRVTLDRLLDPKAGRMWSGHDLMLWHPTRAVLGATLPRRLSTDTLLPVASVVERLVRERRVAKALVLDVSRVQPEGCDEPTLSSFRRFVLEPLAQHPSRVARALLVGGGTLAQSALIGSFVLARLGFGYTLYDRLDVALAKLEVDAAEVLGAVKSELAPLGLVSRVRALIGEDPAVKFRDAARSLTLAPRSLQRALAQSGTTWAQERLDVRLELAASKLMRTSQKAEGIAHDVGYASLAHFLTVFKQRFGITPRAFRARHLAGAS
ncbi:MAG: helix-turn-helix transcriptional regulator [Myxococcaceae bacterium]|nr:helix-turn-helix transcriptional regulator [Myxococcaceae bacterium]